MQFATRAHDEAIAEYSSAGEHLRHGGGERGTVARMQRLGGAQHGRKLIIGQRERRRRVRHGGFSLGHWIAPRDAGRSIILSRPAVLARARGFFVRPQASRVKTKNVLVRNRQPFRVRLVGTFCTGGSNPMADTDTSAAREVGVAKSTILRLIRSSGPASNPETAVLRAEIEGLRLALSLAQESLREERVDKEHWRDEARQLRELLVASKREPEIILAASETVAAPASEPNIVVEAPALAPAAEAKPDAPSTGIAPTQSAAPDSRFRWWGRLFA